MLSEFATEMMVMLGRATDRVGLEWNPSPCPSRLDDRFLREACAGSQNPVPVPFFPEVHDELTWSWMAPFTARYQPNVLPPHHPQWWGG